MPLPLGHAAIGLAVWDMSPKKVPPFARVKTIAAVVLLANLPDIDVLGGLLLRGDGYVFHRGPTHSLVFAVSAAWLLSRPWWQKIKAPLLSWRLCTALILSHLLGDALLSDTPVSFLWPLQIHWSADRGGWGDILQSVVCKATQDSVLIGLCLLAMLARRVLHRALGALERPHVPVSSPAGVSFWDRYFRAVPGRRFGRHRLHGTPSFLLVPIKKWLSAEHKRP